MLLPHRKYWAFYILAAELTAAPEQEACDFAEFVCGALDYPVPSRKKAARIIQRGHVYQQAGMAPLKVRNAG